MSRIRYLKPDFFKDEDLATLPLEARYLFSGLWVLADKEGRLEDRPLRIKVEIFPYENIDIEKYLDLLSKPKNGSGRPFIYRYILNSQKYIQIISWLRHQKPHHTEKESIIPPMQEIKRKEPKENINLKGMENQLEASWKLNNGESTVKNPLKSKYLDCVLLTNEEYTKLIKAFGEDSAKEKIACLNDGIMSKGYKYRSHYHTILSWDRKNKKLEPKVKIAEGF